MNDFRSMWSSVYSAEFSNRVRARHRKLLRFGRCVALNIFRQQRAARPLTPDVQERRFLRRHVARFEHLQLSLEVRHDSDKQSVRQGAKLLRFGRCVALNIFRQQRAARPLTPDVQEYASPEPPRRFLRRHVARFEHLQLSLEVRHDSDKQSVRQGTSRLSCKCSKRAT
jgi:hypothetical protein